MMLWPVMSRCSCCLCLWGRVRACGLYLYDLYMPAVRGDVSVSICVRRPALALRGVLGGCCEGVAPEGRGSEGVGDSVRRPGV